MNFLKNLIKNINYSIGIEEIINQYKKNNYKKFRIKYGIDPTRPDITFGHLVILNKLYNLQLYGHKIIIIIGDFTALIGDPSGRSSTRTMLSKKEVKQNISTYLNQIFKILDKNKTEVYFNSLWFNMSSLVDGLKLGKYITISQLIERDDFANRFTNQKPISLIEFFYPLLQGYDSVKIRSDIEIGGSDQLFNMLIGRSLQKSLNLSKHKQAIFCMPLLIGLDGKNKMSKSFNNYISFKDSSSNMFGKIMSIPDKIIIEYYRLLLNYEIYNVESIHPKKLKETLAKKLIEKFYNIKVSQQAYNEFDNIFYKKNCPQDIPIYQWSEDQHEISIKQLIHNLNIIKSNKKIFNLFKQNAIKCNGKRIQNPFFLLKKEHLPYILQIGKRKFFKIK